jgi:hypothetical protein
VRVCVYVRVLNQEPPDMHGEVTIPGSSDMSRTREGRSLKNGTFSSC